jgi:hypothetical protein
MNPCHILEKGGPMIDGSKKSLERPTNKPSKKQGNKSTVVAAVIIVVLLINIAAMAWYIVANDSHPATSQATITCKINMTTGHNLSVYYLHFHGDILPGGSRQYEGTLNLSQNTTFVLICSWIGNAAHAIQIESWSSTIGSHSYSIHTEIHPSGEYVYYFDL